MKGLIVGGLLVLALGYVAAAPYLTAYRMQAAAEARDPDALARFIDFERVRASLHPQVQARVAGEAERVSDDERLQAAAGLLGGALAGHAVEAYVTPEGIARLMRDNSGAGGNMDGVEAAAGYSGLNRFAIVLTDADSGDAVTLVMTRAGLGWEVTEVRLPQ